MKYVVLWAASHFRWSLLDAKRTTLIDIERKLMKMANTLQNKRFIFRNDILALDLHLQGHCENLSTETLNTRQHKVFLKYLLLWLCGKMIG